MVKRKHHEQHHEEHADETWLVPYSDILTLLLALFIVLFASSTLDKKKMGQMEAAFAVAFNAAAPGEFGGSVGDFLDDAGGLDLGEAVGLGSDAQGAVIEISSLSLFDQGSVSLKVEALPILKRISSLLEQDRYKRFRIVVEGHTDDIEAQYSGFPSKWELSSFRSAAVVREFISSGIAPDRLQVVGMGDIAPKYPNYNTYNEPIPANREKNRRVVIHVEP